MAGMSFETGGGSISAEANRAFKKQLNKVYTWYAGGFIVFVLALAVFEQHQVGGEAAYLGPVVPAEDLADEAFGGAPARRAEHRVAHGRSRGAAG